jgi:hypothetical protein
MVRLLYRPLGMVISAAAGVAAGALFKRLWAVVTHEEEPPSATEPDRSWMEVLVAATAQGATFALVKAAADRAGAVAVQRATGTWPDRRSGSGNKAAA